jgi:hypothetical protein
MAQQQITAHDLERYVYEKRIDGIIGEYGKGYHRQIDYLVGTGEYVVLDHHETVWNGRDANEAIEAYEKIQPH